MHPDLLDRPDQGTFIINKVSISPAKINLSIPKNYEQKISIKVTTQKGTALNNLELTCDDDLPPGVHLTLSDPVPLVGPDRTISLNLTLWADNSAQETGSIQLSVKSDESPDTPWRSVLINTQFSQSEPALYFTPDHIETGVAAGDMVTETLTLKNKGLADMGDVTLELTDDTGNPAPAWVRLNTPSDIGTLAVGEDRKVSISFLPGEDIPQGLHIFYLTVKSSNYPDTDIGLYPMVTASGMGNVLFKISDIYTGTFSAKNELIRGLGNAKIRLQNEQTLADYTAVTDSLGEALFEDLGTGAYKCRVTANNHQEYTGRVWIKPGITVTRDLFLEYNLVTVEWEVNEITIQDKYEILLTATFETDVPAAVVVAEPLSVTLPDMEKGDVYHGEFTLVNHGLIRADDLDISIPESDENFQYEILSGIPSSLDAKQRITIPYRITCLKSLDQEDDTGGGCYTYSKCIPISYKYCCANGDESIGTTKHCLYTSYGTCGSGSGSSGTGTTSHSSPVIITGGSVGGTTTSPAPSYTPMSSPEQKCLPKPDRVECEDGSCKATKKDRSTPIGSEINTVYRRFFDKTSDLSVKVPGGYITVDREYKYGQWVWNQLSTVSDGRPDSAVNTGIAAAKTMSEYGPDYVSRDGIPYKKSSPGVYRQDTYTIERKPDTQDYQADQYRFKDKHGNWKAYDSQGRLMSYGSRYGVIAALAYDSPDDKTPSGVLDRNGTQVLWLEYSGNTLARVYDNDARQVRYDYTEDNLTKVTDVMEHETLYSYDSQNNITQKTNANGRVTHITYNTSGSPVKVEDDTGRTFTFEYDYDKNKKEYYALIKNPAGMVKEVWYNDKGETKRVDINGRTIRKIVQDGRIHTITDELGQKTVKEYDEQENLKRINYPDGTRVLYEYDLRFNKIKTKQDQLDRITGYEYDDTGSLITKIEAKGTPQERTTTYTYDELGRVMTATVEADGSTPEALTIFTYDGQGNLATITDPENNTTQFPEYDIAGNLLRKQDAQGREWTYAYDFKGRLTGSTDPLDHETTYEYDGMDNRTAMVDPEGGRFEYVYDLENNLITTRDPLGNETLFEYSADNKLVKQTDPEGRITLYEYDADRRLAKTTDGAGNVIQAEYNTSGCSSCSGGSAKPDRVIFPTFEKIFTYDTVGRKTSETDVLSTDVSYTTAYEYDNAGNLLKKTDKAGRDTHYVYDSLNRLKTVVDPSDGFTTYAYDTRDNLVELTDAQGNITRFAYDLNNRLVKETRPMGEVIVYTYNPTGSLAAKTDAKNQKTVYTYDDAQRLSQISTYADVSDTTPAKTVMFTYDDNNNLLSYSDGETSGTYTYDDLNRKLSETVNFGPFTKTFTYDWYKNSLKKSFTTPENVAYQYTYNENNQLAGLQIPGVGTISHNTYKWTRPESTLLPGGSGITKTYDALMRTTGITAKDPGANPVMAYTYAFDPMDNITSKATEHGDYAYTYDDLYRLTSSDNPESANEAFSYDGVGNRLSSSDTTGDWTYNNNNELESQGDTSYAYDTNGNMTWKSAGGVITSFFYNIEDRLIKVEDSTGTIAEYGYDPFGRRLWKEVSGTRTYFLYSDEGLIAEYDSTGTEVKSYGWKPGSTWGTDPLFMKQGGEYYFYLNDHLGTPQKMTAVNGAVVWSAKYSSSTIVNNLRFPGQYADAETGLHYNWHRYYDPDTGRYLTPDPIGLAGGINPFVYVKNNPVNITDPVGLKIGWGFSVHAFIVGASTHRMYDSYCSDGKQVDRVLSVNCIFYGPGLAGGFGSKSLRDFLITTSLKLKANISPSSKNFGHYNEDEWTVNTGSQYGGNLVILGKDSRDGWKFLPASLGGYWRFGTHCRIKVVKEKVTDKCCNN